MNNFSPLLKILTLSFAFTMIGGCSFSFSIPFISSDPEGPAVIHEKSIESLEIEPVSLPSTKVPSASLEQAKASYVNLMSHTQSGALKAESLQRLAEIESMIAENAMQQDESEQVKVHLKQASVYYQTLLNDYPDLIDETKIRYQLARVSELDGDLQSAQTMLRQLAKLKGNEFEIIEARFRMAETAYSSRSYKTALELYSQVLQHENNPALGKINSFYNTALFKRGWTEFKTQNYDRAVDNFIALLNIIYISPEFRSNTENSLINETYRVTALSLSYLEGAEDLAVFFNQNGHTDYEADLYLALADLYQQQQRFQDTANTYFTFVKANPLHIAAPKFEFKGIEILSKSGFIDLILAAKENFVLHYQTGAEYWQSSGLIRSDEVSSWLFKNLDHVINYYHAQAQQSKKVPHYLTAAKWYRVFLKSFPTHPKVTDKRWLLAETLFDASENMQSIIEYQILAYQQNNLTQQRKEEAAFRIILGRQKYFTSLEKNSSSEKTLLSSSRTQLIDAGLRYMTVFNGAKRAPEVLSQTIELLLADGRTNDAVTQSRSMATVKWATSSQLKRSREVIANGEFDLSNYTLAEQAYSLIFKLDQYDMKKLNSFHERRAQSIYKQAEAFNEQQKYAAAIEEYLRLGMLEPNSKVRVKADYDAATLLLKIEAYRRAVSVLNQFRNNYPKHELTKNIPAKLIFAYEALSDWQGAAKQYEHVASTATNVEVARTAFWQAATSWMKLPDEQSQNTAVALWKKYIKTYPKPYDLSLEARNNLITLYTSLDVKWKQDFWRRKIILIVDSNKLTDIRARSLAAQSQITLANDMFRAYKSVKLTQPLKKSLNKKRSKLKTSLKGLSKVLDYRIQPISTEAGHRIGESYAILAKAILDSERPKGMSEIELEEYDTLLEERIFPIEDQAIEALEANVSLTKKGVWDKWIKASFKQLEQLMPARYKKPEIIDDYATSP